MSADNFLAIVKEKPRKWVGYYCCASHDFAFAECYACIGTKAFETTSELKAYREAEKIAKETYLEYGYFLGDEPRLTKVEEKMFCPCEIKRRLDK